MGGAEAHLRLNNQLVVDIRAMGMERCTYPYAAAVVFHEDGLMALFPFLIPVLVLHLLDLIFQRHGEGLHRHLEEMLVILVCGDIGLHPVLSLDKTLVGAFVTQRVDQYVAEQTGVVHCKCYFNVFHSGLRFKVLRWLGIPLLSKTNRMPAYSRRRHSGSSVRRCLSGR